MITSEQVVRTLAVNRNRHPTPKVVAIREAFDPYMLTNMKNDWLSYRDHMVRRMAQKLADYIINECDVMVIPDSSLDARRMMQLSMEMTINDKSAYESWIPKAEKAARILGNKEATQRELARVPYGFESDQFYE